MDVGGGLHQAEQGYTAEAVTSYLQAVARTRAELFEAIADARARRDAAASLEGELLELERRVGREVVSWVAIHRQAAGDRRPGTTPQSFRPGGAPTPPPAGS